MIRLISLGAAALVVFMLPLCALAEGVTPNAGDTAWVIVASALVLLMTLPGLAMFYAGLVRPQAVPSVVMQCFVITCLASLLWLIVGYSLAFGDSVGGMIGGLGKAFFARVTSEVVSGSIPETVFAVFQMTFAVIAPALIVGAYVERIKFPAVLIVSGAWTVLVYAPICHLDLGRWLAGHTQLTGLCWRLGGACERGCFGSCHRRHVGCAARLSQPDPPTTQSRYDCGGSRDALGRLVRFQRW